MASGEQGGIGTVPSPFGLVGGPQPAAAPLPSMSPLRLRLNEFTLSSRSRNTPPTNLTRISS
jgi:hypothetical protein